MFKTLKFAPARSRISFLVSFLIHGLVVYLWLTRAPIFVEPAGVEWGSRGNSENLIYFPRTAEPTLQASKLRFRPHARHKTLRKTIEPTVASARAGAPYGSMLRGLASGVEARPALPEVFPDPVVYSWQLPKGLEGDVVVEVTIDEQGIVTETRVLQSLERDIDDRVVAVLKTWRFKPATVDGIAISSRQDVHFHFPS
jgi:TonB family protein